MRNFISRHWKGLAALSVAALCVFVPPMLILDVLVAVAVAPIVAALNLLSIPLEIGMVVGAAAAATYLAASVLEGAVALTKWAGKRLFSLFSGRKEKEYSSTSDEPSSSSAAVDRAPRGVGYAAANGYAMYADFNNSSTGGLRFFDEKTPPANETPQQVDETTPTRRKSF